MCHTRFSLFVVALITRSLCSGAVPSERGWVQQDTPPLASAARVAAVTGFGQVPEMAFSKVPGQRQLYECNLFVSPPSTLSQSFVGPSRRLGAPPNEAPRGDGFFNVTLPVDPLGQHPADVGQSASASHPRYTLYVSQPLFYIRPTVRAVDVTQPGSVVVANVTLPVDYSMERRDSGDWTPPDSCWYQTFVAQGTSITGVSFVLAGTNAKHATVAVLEAPTTNATTTLKDTASPTGWRVVAQASPGDDVGTNTDNWVKWRSGEVPTTPKRAYAVRLCAAETQSDRATATAATLQPYLRHKDDLSYKNGSAFSSSGDAQPFDLAVTVFSDSDGTRVTLAKRTPGIGFLHNNFFAPAWAQSFRAATNASLAAFDVFVAGASDKWNLTLKYTVRKGSPKGAQVGPPKQVWAAYQTDGYGLHGVSFDRDEVWLQAGQVYVVVFEVVDPPTSSPGFNPAVSDDSYLEVEGAWMMTSSGDWNLLPGITLSSTVLEYQQGRDDATEA